MIHELAIERDQRRSLQDWWANLRARVNQSNVGPRHARLTPRIAVLLETRIAWWACLTCVCVVLLTPLFLVDVPPLLDYPNHLARMFVLAFGAHDPVLSHMYAQHWAIIPNLAIDLVVPAMLKLVPIYVAGRIVLGFVLLLPLFGAIAYHRAAFGVRSFWPLAAGLMAYNALFILGLMNFEISLGLALLAGAGWLRWRNQYPLITALLGAVATTAIFFAHILGLVFLVALLGARELAEAFALRGDRAASVRQFLVSLAIAGFALVPPVLLSAAAPSFTSLGRTTWRPAILKPIGLLEPFMAYDGTIDWLFGLGFLGLLYLAARSGKLRTARGINLTLVTLLVLYLACPYTFQGTHLDIRFPIMLGLLVFAGLRPVHISPLARLVVATLMIAAFLSRTASLAEVWYHHGTDVAEMRQVIAPVSAGSRVIVVSAGASGKTQSLPRGREIPGFNRVDFHLPALMVIERRAFWPLLFTAAAKQPLRVLPPYDRLAEAEGTPFYAEVLFSRPSPSLLAYAPYLEDWCQNFDYVLVLDAIGASNLVQYLPDRLTLISVTSVATLYRINHKGAASAEGSTDSRDRPLTAAAHRL